jgi:hypothetical protein
VHTRGCHFRSQHPFLGKKAPTIILNSQSSLKLMLIDPGASAQACDWLEQQKKPMSCVPLMIVQAETHRLHRSGNTYSGSPKLEHTLIRARLGELFLSIYNCVRSALAHLSGSSFVWSLVAMPPPSTRGKASHLHLVEQQKSALYLKDAGRWSCMQRWIPLPSPDCRETLTRSAALVRIGVVVNARVRDV